ncbi:MAG: tetraacyldisaccharide 4'-kinase [Prolixibacteraceae bacterium]|nr:tetraacyldisaccharide 4'-kinase [Prolixibacteraceae bacterium]
MVILKFLLYPFSVIYGIVTGIRNILYDSGILKLNKFKIPVISIGNITVGGTGKTPHTEYLISLLKENYKVAVLSRGYKRKTKGFIEVKTDSPVADVGDEPLQIKRKFPNVTVVVDKDRVRGIRKLIKDSNNAFDVILLDDAFQYRKINASVNILLIDYNRPINKDFILPAGRLRESRRQFKRATIIIYTKCPDNLSYESRSIIKKDIHLYPYQSLFFTGIAYDNPVPVFPEIVKESFLFSDKKNSFLLFSGIANPAPFWNYVYSVARVGGKMIFPDHHFYSTEDIEKIEKIYDRISKDSYLYILTTEKDAMRLRTKKDLSFEIKKKIFYLPIKVSFLGKEENKLFNKKTIEYVRRNK